MHKLPDPEEVDVFVAGVELDPTAALEIERIIEEYKKRPEYAPEAAEAERILAALGINAPDYGVPDATSLFEHWQKCVAEIHRRDSHGTNGTEVDKEEPSMNSSVSGEKPS